MAQPSYLASGTTPLRTDTKQRRWTKILGVFQNFPGAKASNNPLKNDTVRRLKYKILRSINGTGSGSNGGGSIGDPDVDAFIACSGISDSVQISAISVLVSSLKTNSLWTSFDAIYPFVGGSSTAHSCNLRDTSKYSITWAGTVSHNANGITGNGSTGYGDTGFNPTTASSPQFSLNSASIGCYCKTASLLTTSSFMGCNSGASGYANLSTFVLVSNFVSLQGLNTSTSVTQGATSFAGQIIASRTANNAQIVYSPSGQASSSAASVAIPNQNAYLLAANNAGSAVGFITANLAFAFIGSGLSDSQITTLKSIILTYQTALGRQ